MKSFFFCFCLSIFGSIDSHFCNFELSRASLCPMSTFTADAIKQALLDRLPATECIIKDQSGGCGAAFEITKIVSTAFALKPPLARHRLVNSALKEELASIHALSIKQCLTPEEEAEKAATK